MSKKLTFQEIILTLQQFWNDQGCMLMQAYDNEKGAGTMSPYTFLRAIGPEPWNAAYVEPSRRPADGRYGENPNRLYQHHQFQVVMKPSPSNIQELYLESLEKLGINPLEHDTGRAGRPGGQHDRLPREAAEHCRAVARRGAHAADRPG